MTKELEVHRGDTTTIICSLTRNRVVFDLTGYNIILTIKHKYTDPDSSIVFTKEGVIDSPTTGIGKIELSETDTDLETKKYVYDIKIYKPDRTDIKTILNGIFIVSDVARLEIS